MSPAAHAHLLAPEWELELDLELPPGLSIIPGFTESESKALWMVNAFETGGGRTLNLWKLSPDFDGLGISLGLGQWNIGTGSLQPMLREFDQKHPDKFARIFGDGTRAMRDMLALGGSRKAEREEQLKFIRTFTTHREVREPWRTRLLNLGRDPDFQDQMLRKVRVLMDSAVRAATSLGFVSERGLALCFDIHIWPGPYWFDIPKDKPRLRHALPALLARLTTEEEKRVALADAASAGASSKWRASAVQRKRLIAKRGAHAYRKEQWDVERMFGIGDGPFTHNRGGKVPSGASLQLPTSAPAPRPAAASAAPAWQPGLSDYARLVPERMRVRAALQSGVTNPNDLTNDLFWARHPTLRGRKIQAHEKAYAAEWNYLRNNVVKPELPSAELELESGGGIFGFVRTARETALVRTELAKGIRDASYLANQVFWDRHPELRGRKIQAHERDLAAEWNAIRSQVVKPLIPASPPRTPLGWPDAPVAPPVPGAGEKLARKPPPPGITVSPLAQMAWKLRGVTKTRGRKVNAIVVHTTGSGWLAHYKREKGSRPPIWYQLRYYLEDKRGGYAHYVIDYDGSIIVTADEDNEAWHAGWANLKDVDIRAFWNAWKAPWWWQQVWGAQGHRSPLDILPPGARTPNTTSIGIEILPTENREYTDAQLRSLAKLIADIERRHGFRIPSAPSPQLLGHEDLNPLPMAKGGRAYDDDAGGWDPGAHQRNPKFSWHRVWNYLLAARQGRL